MKIATHTSEEKERKVTDTINGDLQQKLLSNWALPIITMTIDPQIDNKIETCGAFPYKIATPPTTEVNTDAVIQTPRRVIWTGRDGTTPGDCEISVIPPGDNSPVLIGGIGVPPTSGHSRSLQVFNK